MKLFTYILRVISAIIFIIAVCNTNITDISTYIIVTIISFTISVVLWQCANALYESDKLQEQREQRLTGEYIPLIHLNNYKRECKHMY
ncbi:MAG: hypothetical protein UIM53_00535 [Acutalibacteraceae bacterium]|nr:hypothetical protein [Acutalibacteraceae bacterium]